MSRKVLTALVGLAAALALLVGAGGPAAAAVPTSSRNGITTWFDPGSNGSSTVWQFNRFTGTGWKQGYLRIGTLGITQQGRYHFTIRQSGATYTLTYPTGTVQRIVERGANPGANALFVNYVGYEQIWFGCSSGRMPYYALSACR
ncbi:hypothetical protein [Cryptosporangium arvum]|uniref:hypothetical protein n=1 Tax=Cryptosporangium arvum TaxID=80871 RepID=UPI0004B92413|nr:hypothetical protein [Cryptosporangium arvum]